MWKELVRVLHGEHENVDFSNSQYQDGPENKHHSLPYSLRYENQLQELDLDNYNIKEDNKEYDFQANRYLSCISADITLIKELRQRIDDGSTLHIEVDSKSAGLTYKTAQNAVIYPENCPVIVEKAAKLLGYNLKDIFVVEKNPNHLSHCDFKLPIPSPISIETYLTKFCDLQSSLR